jgi:hypothetical protein
MRFRRSQILTAVGHRLAGAANGLGHSTVPEPASRVDLAARGGGRGAGPGIAIAAMRATPSTERPRGSSVAAVPPAAPTAAVAPPAPVAPVGPPAPVAAVHRAAPPGPAAGKPAERSPETSAPAKSRRTRGRRFVLPPLDEDQGRSAAAIEAFLGGEPPPGAAAGRPQRRRHRARRPTGSPMPRTTMLVWLQGFGELDRVVGTSRAGHVSNAFFDSLRRLARTTDEVREVGTGRVRIVIDADDAGANAYVERARASVQPWLELLTVPLRVETGARESTEVFPFAPSRRVVGDH